MKDVEELLEEAHEAHRRLHGITIRGPGFSGDARRGFIFNPAPVLGESGEGAGGFTGACCIGEACAILSATDCAAAGGVYQGDFTPCSPNPCVAVLPPCNGCGYDAFDGSGRKFLRKSQIVTETASDCCGNEVSFCARSIDGMIELVTVIDPETCMESTETDTNIRTIVECGGTTLTSTMSDPNSYVVTSATTKEEYVDDSATCDPACSGQTQTHIYSGTITLSDECQP
jgi:hypothetical protein